MRRLAVSLGLLALLLAAALLVGAQATPENVCITSRGFGTRTERAAYTLDLLCQPTLLNTLEISSGNSITVTVDLVTYYRLTGRSSAIFDIHLAMDRARIRLREPDSLSSTEINDLGAALQSVRIETGEPERYTFIIENLGVRSAVFDLTVRPEL
jgi:hypothetical protein